MLYHIFNDFMQISIMFWIFVSIQFSLKYFHFYSISIQFSKKFFISIQFEFSFLSQFGLSLYSVYIQLQLTDPTLSTVWHFRVLSFVAMILVLLFLISKIIATNDKTLKCRKLWWIQTKSSNVICFEKIKNYLVKNYSFCKLLESLYRVSNLKRKWDLTDKWIQF
jgi:hypothetical protein